MLNNELATIQFMPVCSNCKKILLETINVDSFYEEVTDKNALYIRYTITPPMCPYCKTHFNSITMPTKLPYDNTLKISADGHDSP